MSQYNLRQLTIEEVINTGFTFKIPDYQRGYRWGETEVKDLLTDISEIKDPHEIKKVLDDQEKLEYYCLQPVVFKEEGNNIMEVVDGQQRLTTLFLIISHINSEIKKSKQTFERVYGKDKFDLFEKKYGLEYTNTKRQKNFAEIQSNISNINMDNVDAYYITSAYSIIQKWSDKIDGIDLLNFAIKLYKGTSVIWYELNPDTDGNAGDYFAKINSGKIALTNSELIKANLMLDEYCLDNVNINFTDEDPILRAQKEKDFKELKKNQLSAERIKISRQWDEIEENLRNSEFWYFITDLTDKYNDTRIDFLFDILAKQKYNDIKEEDITFEQFKRLNEQRATFIIIARYLKKQKQQNTEKEVSIILWKEIWDYYMTFKEWFNNRELYHLIGYIIAVDSNYNAEKLLSIISDREIVKTKSDVKKKLLEIIKKEAKIPRTKEEYLESISKLKYDKTTHEQIKKTLLLFNVIFILNDKAQTIQTARDTFFPYGRYKSEKWNLEHIHSQADGDFDTKTAVRYMEHIEKMLEMLKKINKNSQDYKNMKSARDTFEKKYQELQKNGIEKNAAYISATIDCANTIEEQFGKGLNDDSINCIGNMALLDEKTNKSYKNAPFFMKRMVISDIVNGKTDISRFIPLCTRNVFDKSYSKVPGNMLQWTDDDCKNYLNLIVDTIWNYFEVNK